MTRLALALLLAPWLVVSTGAKLLRYAPEREASAPRAERLVRQFLEAQGWRFAERRPITGAGLYRVQSFTRTGCPRPLEVAVLGVSNESAEVVRASLGPDTVFFTGGRFVASPSAAEFARQAALAGLSLASDRIMAPLAVSPAPRQDDRSRCASPQPSEWAQIGGVPHGG